MNQALIDENKAKLIAEQNKLKAMLGQDTTADSEIPGGRKPKYEEAGTEESENAQESEQFADDLSVTEDLDARLKVVGAALQRIVDGSYGKCSVGGEAIPEARLRAEPAAATCIQHSK